MKNWTRLHCDLQKIIALFNCKYCFEIKITYIIIVCIARVKASVNGNSIRNTFTDCIGAICIVLVYVLSEVYLRIKLNFWLPYPNLGINHSVNKQKITLQEF